MTGISYDPDEDPQIDPVMMEEGLRMGLVPINVVCLEADGQAAGSVAFAIFVSSVPRMGEHIELQDGSLCEVTQVYHRIARPAGYCFFGLNTTVTAVRRGTNE